MKLIYDGFAITPKRCFECNKRFIFEKYITFERVFLPCCKGTEYVCKSCYEKKLKDKEVN